MEKFVRFLLFAIMSAIPSISAAEDMLYIGLSASKSDMQQGCPPNIAGCKKTSQVFRLQGGFQFSQRTGIEFGYGSLGEAVLPSGAKASASGLDVSLVLKSPTFEEKLNSVVKVGLLSSELDNGFIGRSAASSKMILGIGLQYQTSREVSVRALYEDYGLVGDSATGQTYIKLLTIGVLVGF